MTAARRHALVLASSTGIGHACAASLAQAGHSVCLNGRDPVRLLAAADQIRLRCAEAAVSYCAADLNTCEDRDKVVQQAGHADILVLNMGGPPVGNQTLSLAEWQAAFDSIFMPMTDILDRILPGMIARSWGRVVMISSAAVRQPIPNLVVSGVFRTGLASLLSVRAVQVARYGVTINSLLPGRILTDRQNRALEREAAQAGITKDAQLAKVSESIPMGRLGTPEEMGNVCAFLCSEGASYVTGQNILVDGGAFRGVF
ncbi:SDR family oxidoreductase [Pusillimonas sp. TS35]|uniref:SDR family oxidoreductase n=1 Tax=Paracandidimonas lactea TaxID=2895524 RepID=UPI00136CBF37|nr:SDR family oxidoreductase [Paracandidimonas lactea]MYN13299.1 SDR family oxidoreductase [Pusillimonas sp. TS35]